METPFPVDMVLPRLKPGRKEGINNTARMAGALLTTQAQAPQTESQPMETCGPLRQASALMATRPPKA